MLYFFIPFVEKVIMVGKESILPTSMVLILELPVLGDFSFLANDTDQHKEG